MENYLLIDRHGCAKSLSTQISCVFVTKPWQTLLFLETLGKKIRYKIEIIQNGGKVIISFITHNYIPKIS